jgi:aldehyde:ferredoxin oxidoreductase
MFTVDMAISVPLYASSINIATGMNLNEKDIYHIGERISNLERLFNLREGIDGSTDCLPARLKEIASGDGHTVDVGAMVAEYYKVRQWDEDGVPTREILNKLNL